MKKISILFAILFLGCVSPAIKMSQEELNETTVNDPGTTLIVDPSLGAIIGEQSSLAPPPSNLSFCHCLLTRECRNERTCIASYCFGCPGVDPEQAVKVICI